MLMDDRVVKAISAHSGYGTMSDKGIGCLNMTVPGICAHEAAMDEDRGWIDVPLFER